MPFAAEFDPVQLRLSLWRAVEAQHIASTMVLVDSLEEQRVLEQLLESRKPAIPANAESLHYLLFTPFRYPPTAYGSRFRRPGEPGVFYGADGIRTACAELGYWRWRFLMDSPELARIPPAPQTLFRVGLFGLTTDLRLGALARRRAEWTDPVNYSACQTVAEGARRSGIAVIRYESVRDPQGGGAAAVLDPGAFINPRPLSLETWYLGITRQRVWWCRERFRGDELEFEFEMTRWI